MPTAPKTLTADPFQPGEPQIFQGSHLVLPRCPHCAMAWPSLNYQNLVSTNALGTKGERHWYLYACTYCGGVIMAVSPEGSREVRSMWPTLQRSKDALPERARHYLDQARETLAQASASIVMAAAAIDAMLKAKGFKEGDLYSRIDRAADAHLITVDMAAWAHQVRLDANGQRHADEALPLPTMEDATRCLDFADAFGEVVFVLPARVTRGKAAARKVSDKSK